MTSWYKVVNERCFACSEKASKMNQEQFPFAEQLMKSHPHNIQHCYDKSGQPGMVAFFVYASCTRATS